MTFSNKKGEDLTGFVHDRHFTRFNKQDYKKWEWEWDVMCVCVLLIALNQQIT